ncbi:hypothetical protein RJ640_022042 [Escallonia rubra]|uniref:HIRAN domain-containing protein n=1 Tax=Escallonia rubra TaxID=112253 RepID=A0AA88RB07_9ASTE|nr:hypothetical protein RJ640_022042 [Escallonia rubra]
MSSSPPMTVKKTVTSTGARISTRIKQGSQESDMEAADALKPTVGLKKSASDVVNEYREHLQAEKAKEMANEDVEESGSDIGSNPGLKVKEESNLGVEEKVQAQENPYTGLSYDEYRDYKRKQKMADNEVVETGSGLGSIPVLKAKEESEEIKPDLGPERKVNEEDGKMAVKGDPCVGFMGSEDSPDREFAEYIRAKGWRSTANEKDHTSQTKEERPEEANDAESGFLSGCMVKKEPEIESNTQIKEVLCLAKPVSSRPAASVTAFSSMMRGHTAKKERVEDRSLSTVLIEDGDFPEEPDWLLVGRTAITGLSTAKGRKLENNEIVHIAFPTGDARFKQSGIVRFSTKRSGEIGRLPMEWAKCLTPLVNSSKGDVAEAVSVLPMVKRQKGSQQYLEPNKDEQAISESSLNKLVGAAEVYNLEEMEPPCTLMCDLRPYQKQALYWMSESEKGIDVEKASETLHPCWAAYHICDE